MSVYELWQKFFISVSHTYAESSKTIRAPQLTNARRISIAKALLAEGKNVSEVYGSVGFNDYSSFLKAFVKLVGVSPKKYSKFN